MLIAVLRRGAASVAAFVSVSAIALSVPASGLAQTRSALNLAMVAEPPTLDVQSTPADLVCIIMQHVYEPLFTFDAASNLVPMLADGMPKVSADGKAYSIALRKGVKLHNGRELDAEDVVASLKRWMEVSPRGKSVSAQVESLAAKGPLAVEIALKEAPGRRGVEVGPEARYFNAAAWSPDGAMVAAVIPAEADGVTGAELVIANPNTKETIQVTDFLATVGAIRIGGIGPGGVSWSPDSRYVAFWGAPLTGEDPEIDVQPASLYIYDHELGETRHYCGVTVEDITPEPPRLVWSPDGTHVAFAGNPPDDMRGSLLLALDIESGVFTELTEGMSNLMGRPNILAWGLRP